MDDQNTTERLKQSVKDYWNKTPLLSESIAATPGTPEFFAEFDAVRESKADVRDYESAIHRFDCFAGKHVLDVGCGNGWLLMKYASKGALVTGVDITEKAIELTKRRFDMAGIPAELKVSDAENLPFQDASFDLVTSTGVLHHTPNTEAGIREVSRVLRPGGTAIIMLYHKNSAQYWWAMTYYRWKAFIKTGKLPSRQEMINWTDGKGNPLGKAYTRQQVTSMTEPYFERVKIEVWELRPCMLPIPLFGDRLSRKLPKRWLSVLSNYIGWYIYAICTKRS